MNVDETLKLLEIMNLANQWPQFQALHDIAAALLIEANNEAKVELKKRAEDKVKAEADAKLKLDAEAKARAEAEAKPAPAPQVIPLAPTQSTDIERRVG